uniref:Uncharacterized protein n=1 Tax=Fagus sylvatica TaxID=28930 RepID=A0A2N9I6G6_FAGSY
MLWLPRWTGNMPLLGVRGVYSVGRVSAWLVAPCLLLMLAPEGKCLASSTLSLDANTWGQFYYWYKSQVPGQGYASPPSCQMLWLPRWTGNMPLRGYSVGRVSAWLVAPCLLLMLAPGGKCLASSTLSLDANTWGQFYYWYKSQVPGQGYASPPSCQMLWLPRWTGNMWGVYSVGRVSAWLVAPCLLLMLAPGGKCLASSTLSLDANTWGQFYYWYKSQVPGQGYASPPSCQMLWLPRWTGNMRGVYSVGRVSAWLVAPCLLLMLAPGGKCLASSTLSLDANTWGQFYYWYKSQVPGQGYASPPSCQMLWLPRWTGNMRGVYSVGRVSAWLVAPCLLLMLAPGGKCLASNTLSLDANTWGQFYYWYKSQVPGQGYASPPSCQMLWLPRWTGNMRGVYSVGRVSAWLVAPCLLLMLAPGGKCLASSTLSLDANTWGQFYYWYKSQVPGQGYASPPSCQMLWLPRWTGNMRGVYSVGRVSAWLVAPCLLLMLAPGGKCLASSTLSLDARTWG